MPELTTRIDDDVKQRLQTRAAAPGVSSQEEVGNIRRAAVMVKPDATQSQGQGSRIAARFASVGLADEEAWASTDELRHPSPG
jgi:plasmid stability protein